MSAIREELGLTRPDSTKLNLSFRGLTDLAALLPSLSPFTELNDLDLRGNALEALPTDLSSLAKLQTLDISQNPIAHASSIMAGLASLPSLRYLSVSLGRAEEAALLRALPGLAAFNGAPVSADPGAADGSRRGAGPVVREIAMTEGDLESVAVLYGGIKSLRGRISAQEDARLTSVFDTHIRTIMSDLKVRLDKLDDPFLRQGEILSAKYELYDVCFQQCIDHASSTSREFGSVLRKLRGIHQTLFSEFPRVVYDMKPVYDERVRVLETELDRAREETAQLLEAAELLESESQQQQDERLQERDAFESERESLLAEVESLRKQVHKLQGRVTSGSGASIRHGRVVGGPKPIPTTGAGGGGPGRGGHGAGSNGASAGRPEASTAAPPPAPASRVLTLKQLKEVIDAIYASKVKFDQKCAEAKLPRETMEQHMYTYLNQKYGLKSLIIEHASSIIRAVNKYGKSDNDIGVFGRILRNEIDEEFRHVQTQLKESVEELLGVYLKGRFPLKTDKAIRTMLAERMQGFVFEEEWVDIIKYMYNQKDSLVLIVLVKDAIRSSEDRASPTPTTGRARGVRGKIRFFDFLKILLDFQLKAHERFLSRFRQVFRSIDADKNGIVDEAEFRSLVTRISPTKTTAQLDDLVRAVDPHSNAHITFSQCVNALSNELVKDAAEGGP